LKWTEHVSTASKSDRPVAGPPPIAKKEYRIEIRVREPESFLKFLQVAYAESQGWNPLQVEGSRWPVVIAVNRLGQERQLLECETTKKATAEVERVRADLEILGLRIWCEKYGVPPSFVTA
jgi:hypothetical protein